MSTGGNYYYTDVMSGSTYYSIKIRDDAHELEWWERLSRARFWIKNYFLTLFDDFVIFLTENEVREKCYLINVQWRKLKIFWIYFRRFLIVSSSLRNFSHHLRLDLLSKFSLPFNYHFRGKEFLQTWPFYKPKIPQKKSYALSVSSWQRKRRVSFPL